jgi:phosphopantothenoylcysteine decarboxylase/phosphopantothenate--cysteine ligase
VNVLLGVSGGIAAYKACELTSLLVKAGHSVRVAMTAGATRFVGPVTFEGLTGMPVLLDTFADPMAHVDVAKWADVAAVAPLSANTLARLACGLADDVLSTTLLALPRGRRCVLGPAMNTEMWFHPVVQRNLEWLRAIDRFVIVEPIAKRLACGDVGPGALAEPADLLAAIEAAVAGSVASAV